MNAHTMPQPCGPLIDSTVDPHAGPHTRTLAVVYHSAHGHSAHNAGHVAAGAEPAPPLEPDAAANP